MNFLVALVQWLLGALLSLVALVLTTLYIRGAFRWRSLFHIQHVLSPSDPRFPTFLKSLSGSVETRGRVLNFWAAADDIQQARLDAISRASRSVQFETFMMTPGKRADDFADALARKATAGVSVQLLVDSWGTRSLKEKYWKRLRSVGVEVVFFNPFDWRAPINYAGRTHRKLLIIDDTVALVGGAGISGLWDGTEKSDDTRPWFDIEFSVTGEIVNVLSTIFQAHWRGHKRQNEVTHIDMTMVYGSEENCRKDAEIETALYCDETRAEKTHAEKAHAEKTHVERAYAEESKTEESRAEESKTEVNRSDESRTENSPEASDASSIILVTAGTKPSYRNSPIETTKQTLIASARERIWLASPYFLPNMSTRNLLIEAQKSGIEVRILTTSDRSDKKPVYYASYEVYGPLLEAGIKIFEYQPSMLHAKMLLIDHLWTNTGSANLDYRSFLHNDELDVLTTDRTLRKKIEQTFEKGFSESKQITLHQWKRRSWLKHRILGNIVRLVQWQL